MPALYRSLLGSAFDDLHPNVRAAHQAPLAAEGVIDVVHGSHRLARLLRHLMGLPAQGAGQATQLRVSLGRRGKGHADAARMIWTRQIGGSTLRTTEVARRGRLVERNGPGSIDFSLSVHDGALISEQCAMRFLGMRLPARVAPHVHARVSPEKQGWHVDVTVVWRGHLVCRYGGSIWPK